MLKRIISCIFAVLLLLSVCTVAVFAADETAEYDHAYIYAGGKAYKAEVGDIITYDAFITTDEKFVNIQANIAYESELLRIVRYPSADPDLMNYENETLVCCPNLKSPTVNLGYRENAARFVESYLPGYDFGNAKSVITLQFEVINNGRGAIEMDIEEMLSVRYEAYFSNSYCMVSDPERCKLEEVLDAPECTDAPEAVRAPFVEDSFLGRRSVYLYNELDWSVANICSDRYGYEELNGSGKRMRKNGELFEYDLVKNSPDFKIVGDYGEAETELIKLPNDLSLNTIRITGEYTEADGTRVYEVCWDKLSNIPLKNETVNTDPPADNAQSPAATEDEPAVSPSYSAMVLFEDSLGWGDIYAYTFSTTSNKRELGEWPGTACMQYTDNICYINVPSDFEMIIFSSRSNGLYTVQAKNELITGHNALRLTGETVEGDFGGAYDAYWDTMEKVLEDNGIAQEEIYAPETTCASLETVPVAATECAVDNGGVDYAAPDEDKGVDRPLPSTDPTSATGAAVVASSDGAVIKTGDKAGGIVLSAAVVSVAGLIVLSVIYKNRRKEKNKIEI